MVFPVGSFKISAITDSNFFMVAARAPFPQLGVRLYSQEATAEDKNDESYHSIIKDKEKGTGERTIVNYY